MAKNTLTFELGGRVEIADFANGIVAFRLSGYCLDAPERRRHLGCKICSLEALSQHFGARLPTHWK